MSDCLAPAICARCDVRDCPCPCHRGVLMSDTRNHTTRDQLAAAFRSVAWLEYQDGRTEWAAFEDDLLDALEPVIAAVRAAAVAETTAAIEALPRLRRWIDDSELVDLADVRAALNNRADTGADQ